MATSKNNKKQNRGFSYDFPNDMKYLIIHESNGECKEIKKFINSIEKLLGGKTDTIFTTGHIYETSSKELDINLETHTPKRHLQKDKKDITDILKKGMDIVKKNGGQIILSTDPDREGEKIAYEMVKLGNLKKGEYKRAYINAMSEKEYLKALENSKDDIDYDMFNSGVAREVIDKETGWFLTAYLRYLSNQYSEYYINEIKDKIDNDIKSFEKKYPNIIKKFNNVKKYIDNLKKIDWDSIKDNNEIKKGISVGRVQSPTLKLIVEKKLKELNKNLDLKYDLYITDENDNNWIYSKNKEFETNYDILNLIYKNINKQIKNGKIKEIYIDNLEEKEYKSNPGEPFKATSLMNEASRIYNINSKSTEEVANKLYRNGLLSYFRTDSITVPDTIQDIIKKSIEKIGEKFVKRNYKDGGQGNVQQGHHAIVFLEAINDINEYIDKLNLSFLESKEKDIGKKILELVIRRTISSFMEEALLKKIDYSGYVIMEYDDGKGKKENKNVYFQLTSRNIIKEGYLKVYYYNKEDKLENSNINLKEGDSIKVKDINLKEKDIKMQGGLKDSTVNKELEKMGIGRPSTYKTLIPKLEEKGYITLSKNGDIEITPKGYRVYDLLQNFPEILDYNLTAEMENLLDKVSSGNKKDKEIVEKMRNDIIKKYYDLSGGGSIKGGNQGEEIDKECPKCGTTLVQKELKSKKTGEPFILVECPNYEYAPNKKNKKNGCDYSEFHNKVDENSGEQMEDKCPLCDGKLTKKEIKNGKMELIQCVEGDYTDMINKDGKWEKLDDECPKCGTELILKGLNSKKTGKYFEIIECPNYKYDPSKNNNKDGCDYSEFNN